MTTADELHIRPMNPEDWASVSRIYTEGMATGAATFETVLPAYASWDAAHMQTCRIVAMGNGIVLGWAALSPVSVRCVYEGVAEVSIYVGKKSRGKSIGTMIMTVLIKDSEAAGIWTLQSGIFPENKSSIKLHK